MYVLQYPHGVDCMVWSWLILYTAKVIPRSHQSIIYMLSSYYGHLRQTELCGLSCSPSQCYKSLPLINHYGGRPSIILTTVQNLILWLETFHIGRGGCGCHGTTGPPRVCTNGGHGTGGPRWIRYSSHEDFIDAWYYIGLIHVVGYGFADVLDARTF